AGARRDDHDRFGAETTARLAGAWQLSDTLTVRASWGEGFKAPTLFQTTFFCCGAEQPNPDLSAETSEAFDVGIDWESVDDRIQLSATVFQQDTENMIDFDFGIGGYLNIEEVESTGLELSGAVLLSNEFSLTIDYAYIDAEDGFGNALIRVPENSGDVSLAYNGGGPLTASLLVRYNGSETNLDGVTELDAWTRVDLNARYAWSPQLEIYGRIENLFDEEYQQILGYGTPELSGTMGVRLRY
ncbi:MAG: TonB-dependent receptor, partial [Pseudomonadota bacterium]